MKTVEEVIAFLNSEIVRLEGLTGWYGDEIDYLKQLIEQIKRG
jgi:hypothetical protein